MNSVQRIGLGTVLALAIGAGITTADEMRSSAGVPDNERYVETERLDALFKELKRANSESHAQQIERMIWEVWTHPVDEELAERMEAMREAQRWQAPDLAIRILDRIIERWDGYAEAYNQRAYMYFQKGEYEQALADIAATLAREPRHFGSLAGRGLIRLQQGKRALAMQNIMAALDHHPYLREKALFPELMSK